MEESIVDILMRRDEMTRADAEAMLEDAKQRVSDGEYPEDVLYEDFGLEPDYIFQLLD